MDPHSVDLGSEGVPPPSAEELTDALFEDGHALLELLADVYAAGSRVPQEGPTDENR